MTLACCPRCPGLYGPEVGVLLRHLWDVHGLGTDWFEASTGTLKLAGWLPGTVETVKEGTHV